MLEVDTYMCATSGSFMRIVQPPTNFTYLDSCLPNTSARLVVIKIPCLLALQLAQAPKGGDSNPRIQVYATGGSLLLEIDLKDPQIETILSFDDSGWKTLQASDAYLQSDIWVTRILRRETSHKNEATYLGWVNHKDGTSVRDKVDLKIKTFLPKSVRLLGFVES